MPEAQTAGRAQPPDLPWWLTILVVAMIFGAGIVKPFAPHGWSEYLTRLVGRPPTLVLGHGRSVRLVEETAISTGCQVSDVRWMPDGSGIVAECSGQLQARLLDGRLIGKAPADEAFGDSHLQILADPLRVLYLNRFGGSSGGALVLWNVGLQDPPTVIEGTRGQNFAVDASGDRVALVGMGEHEKEIGILQLQEGHQLQTFQIPSESRSLGWVPGTQNLLLGGYDGILRQADTATGVVRELANAYSETFASGGRSQAMIDGLVFAPDGHSLVIFGWVSGISPAPGSNFIDVAAEAKWLGAGVQIRSVEDGRLLAQMPGSYISPQSVSWDPKDRFIAIAGHDALYLWDRREGGQVLMTFGDGSIPHRISIANDGSRIAVTGAANVRIFRIDDRKP